MGCIETKICLDRINEESEHSIWITVIASILAAASLCMLAVIALMCSGASHIISRILLNSLFAINLKPLWYYFNDMPYDLKEFI